MGHGLQSSPLHETRGYRIPHLVQLVPEPKKMEDWITIIQDGDYLINIYIRYFSDNLLYLQKEFVSVSITGLTFMKRIRLLLIHLFASRHQVKYQILEERFQYIQNLPLTGTTKWCQERFSLNIIFTTGFEELLDSNYVSSC